MPGVDLKRLRREISIQQVLDLLKFTPTARVGPRLRGPCPIHGSRHAGSRIFSVHLGCHRYHCFRCHSAGNQIELWAAVHRLTKINKAAEDLCHHLGIPVPYLSSRDRNHRTSS